MIIVKYLYSDKIKIRFIYLHYFYYLLTVQQNAINLLYTIKAYYISLIMLY